MPPFGLVDVVYVAAGELLEVSANRLEQPETLGGRHRDGVDERLIDQRIEFVQETRGRCIGGANGLRRIARKSAFKDAEPLQQLLFLYREQRVAPRNGRVQRAVARRLL